MEAPAVAASPTAESGTCQNTESAAGDRAIVRRNRQRALLGLLTLLAVSLVWWSHQKRTQPHSVTLTWRAPSPQNGVTVAGYNVYRSTGEGSEFVRIATRVPGPSYVDRLVNRDRTYFYAVTAVDQAGRESRFSTQVKAEVP
jgi:hypothetical protein